MAGKQSEQSPGYPCEVESALAKLIKKHLVRQKMTQKELAENALLPEARISRIMRGRTSKGNSVRITEQDINRIALALRIGRQGRDELLYAAFPERVYIERALEQRHGIIYLNGDLADHGLPTLELNSK